LLSGGEAAVLEESEQVAELAVDIPADLQRGLELQQARLRDEDLPRLRAQALHLALGQLHVLPRFRATELEQLVDHGIDVNVLRGLLHPSRQTK